MPSVQAGRCFTFKVYTAAVARLGFYDYIAYASLWTFEKKHPLSTVQSLLSQCYHSGACVARTALQLHATPSYDIV